MSLSDCLEEIKLSDGMGAHDVYQKESLPTPLAEAIISVCVIYCKVYSGFNENGPNQVITMHVLPCYCVLQIKVPSVLIQFQ